MRKQVLSIAALLGELEGLLGQAPSALVQRYPALFQRYYSLSALQEALAGQGPTAALLAGARALAEAAHGGGGEPTLRNVFSALSVEGAPAAPTYFPIRPLTVDEGMFPQAAPPGPEALAGQRAAFYCDMDQISRNPPDSAVAFELLMDTLLQKYTWCLPARWGGGDVCLYDAARITAAIAVCLERCGERAQPFLLITGDFSGIQSYIFSVARTAARGVAKRLRARSFLIDATVTALAHTTARHLEVPVQSILMLCGGKFQLLAPNLPEQAARLDKLRRETDRYLFRRYKGEISVNLAWVSFGPEGFSQYGDTVTRLAQALREQKDHPFAGALLEEGHWREEAFSLYDDLAGKTRCPSCQSRLIPAEAESCEECALQTTVGGQLARASTLWYSHGGGELELLEDCYLSFSCQKAGQLYQVVRLNSWDIPPELTCFPLTVRTMAGNLPTGPDGEGLSFPALAARSPGDNLLGVFKADVDNLGYLFADGFRGNGKGGTVGRVTALSRMLELFFSGYVNALLKREYSEIYTVFAGGDDLFLIGPWDTLADLAVRLERAFHRFTGGNPCLTLSGALTMANPSTHIAALSEDCEGRLKQVKEQPPGRVYPDKQGRDAVYFMGQTFTWADLRRQLSIGRQLLQTGLANNMSALQRILQFSQMYQKFLDTGDVFQLMYDPLFFYDRQYHYKQLLQQDPWLSGYIDQLVENAADLTHINSTLYFAQTAARYAMSGVKEARKYGL